MRNLEDYATDYKDILRNLEDYATNKEHCTQSGTLRYKVYVFDR